MRKEITLPSGQTELSGWWFEPSAPSPWPVVVMAHGFSATRQMIADKYAEAFCAAGFAVLLYDHPGFGASGGEPRLHHNSWLHARGYRDAISYVRGLSEADAERIAAWGDSSSGGVALAVTAIDPRVAALVVQVPSIGAQPAPPDPDGELYRKLRASLESASLEPRDQDVDGPLPVVSDDQVRRPSALRPLTAYRWFIEHGGRLGSGWVNDVSRAHPKGAPAWQPGLCASHVSCPVLFVVAPDDEMPGSSPTTARDAFERLQGPKEWRDIEGGHFGLLYHPSPEFDRASTAQVEFLQRHLQSRSHESSPLSDRGAASSLSH